MELADGDVANVYNPEQTDTDGDGVGDICDDDSDNDGVNEEDNCITEVNPSQRDIDSDLVGDACDNCVNVANEDQANSDQFVVEVNSIPPAVRTLTEAATNIDLEDDDSSDALPSAFLPFFGQEFVQWFHDDGGLGEWNSDKLFTKDAPNNIIAGYWTDLDPSLNSSGDISYELLGEVPNRESVFFI